MDFVSLPENCLPVETIVNLETLVLLGNWGGLSAMTDLSNEVLVMVFQYLGYVHQQRLVRVCRRWKSVITCQLDHVFMDAVSLLPGLVSRQQQSTNSQSLRRPSVLRKLIDDEFIYRKRRDSIVPGTEWKYANSTVRRLTFDGQRLLNVYSVDPYLERLALRFINLTELTLTRVIIDSPFIPMKRLLLQRPTVTVLLREAAVHAFPCIVQNQFDCARVLGSRAKSYVRAAETISVHHHGFNDYLVVLEHIVWPHPDQQLEWLARHAPLLNDREDLMVILGAVLGDDFYPLRDGAENTMCPEHKKFCHHLDVNFYKTKLDGHVRNLLASFIQQLPVPAPPFPFQLETFKVLAGRRQLTPDV